MGQGGVMAGAQAARVAVVETAVARDQTAMMVALQTLAVTLAVAVLLSKGAGP